MGANLARRLLAGGHRVHLLLRPGHRPWRLEGIRDRVTAHVGSLGDAAWLDGLLKEARPQWVFHLAAYGGYASQTDLPEMLRTNVLGMATFLSACLKAGFEAFVNAGSSSEYGYVDHPPAESERLEPNSDYAVTKAFATQHGRSLARRLLAPITTLRLYSVYGPWEEKARLLPTLIREGLNGRLPPLVSPETARDFVHVDDVCEAFVLAASRPSGEAGAIYNVGTGVQTRIREVVEVARRVLRITAEPRWGTMEPRPWDTTTWVADSRKIREELGFSPRFPFEEGFRQMVAWTRREENAARGPGGRNPAARDS